MTEPAVPAGGSAGLLTIARRLTDHLRRTLASARLDRHEVAGSLGDLGTFLPLLVGMAAKNGLDFATALFFAGFFNVVTGLTFSIPMAVQPMKAIAAVALTEGLSVGEIVAAGATVSLVVLALGVTGLIDHLNRAIPKSVVRGLQLALGLSLLMKGLQMVAGTNVWFGPDSILVGAAAATFVLALFFSPRVPSALVLFGCGVVLAVVENPAVVSDLHLHAWFPSWSPPAWSDFLTAFPKAALPQIPLTTLN
jgi:predicted benzoate:H+ symporter BenE